MRTELTHTQTSFFHLNQKARLTILSLKIMISWNRTDRNPIAEFHTILLPTSQQKEIQFFTKESCTLSLICLVILEESLALWACF